ncbi:MAG: hypothetical protein JW940_17695 [Polyangiaceae bacterium]|nr:hypothetical protein [Polyangiaceae bacterium]
MTKAPRRRVAPPLASTLGFRRGAPAVLLGECGPVPARGRGCGVRVGQWAYLALACWAALLLAGRPCAAEPRLVDRAVVRFVASETGGLRSPQFICERMLAFEARLEALSESRRVLSDRRRPYLEHHVRAAMDRHIAETLLASLAIDPEPSHKELDRQAVAAERMLVQRIGGASALESAAAAEGIDRREVFGMLRRRARASLYLDRMVAPMLVPSTAELERVHLVAPEPLRSQSFSDSRLAVERWYVARQLAEAVMSYYQGARSRVRVTLLSEK